MGRIMRKRLVYPSSPPSEADGLLTVDDFS
jgi:hypothetical protein